MGGEENMVADRNQARESSNGSFPEHRGPLCPLLHLQKPGSGGVFALLNDQPSAPRSLTHSQVHPGRQDSAPQRWEMLLRSLCWRAALRDTLGSAPQSTRTREQIVPDNCSSTSSTSFSTLKNKERELILSDSATANHNNQVSDTKKKLKKKAPLQSKTFTCGTRSGFQTPPTTRSNFLPTATDQTTVDKTKNDAVVMTTDCWGKKKKKKKPLNMQISMLQNQPPPQRGGGSGGLSREDGDAANEAAALTGSDPHGG